MPKINEHEPIHVHVIQGDRQLIYEIMIENGKFKSVVRRNAKRLFTFVST